ncbi:MAG TPA: hypothetical protein VM871_12375, partial [Flavisolibacter sp.]|nr:hypothetical protein [Flavisolibacter sp.]
MRSLFFLSVMNGAPWGGSEELWYRTALRAANQGYRVGCAFYEWDEKKEKTEALQKAGCRVYLLPNKGRRKANLAERIQYKLSKWQLKRIIPSIPFQDYELVVVNLGGLEIYTPAWRDALRYLPAYVLLFHSYS